MNAHTFLLERLERRGRERVSCPCCADLVELTELRQAGSGALVCAACQALPRADKRSPIQPVVQVNVDATVAVGAAAGKEVSR